MGKKGTKAICLRLPLADARYLEKLAKSNRRSVTAQLEVIFEQWRQDRTAKQAMIPKS